MGVRERAGGGGEPAGLASHSQHLEVSRDLTLAPSHYTRQMAEPAAKRPPDEELRLAQQCGAGDRAAQHALFMQQRMRVHRTLFRILGSNRHMEDLLQDTFIEVLGSIGSFAGHSSLATWVDSIAARVAFRHLSRREPRPEHLQAVDELPSSQQGPDQQGRGKEAMRRLYAVLDRLEPKYRIAYTLHVIDGRPVKEVARVTRTSTIAVKNRVWRARHMVRTRAQRDPLLAEFLPRDDE